jgi:hypothetical protein
MAKKINQIEQGRQTFLIRVPQIRGSAAREMEAFFADLHRQLYSQKGVAVRDKIVSFEMALIDKFLHFYFDASPAVADLVSGQIYAHFPGSEIEEVTDYTQDLKEASTFLGAQMRLENKDIYPIKTYENMEVDSLVGLSGVMSKIKEKETQLWVQLVLSPVEDTFWWQQKRWLKRLVKTRIEPNEGYKASLGKFEKYYFKAKLRVCCLGKDTFTTRRYLDALVRSFDSFDNGALNGIEGGRVRKGQEALLPYQARELKRGGYCFNVEELASLYHFPSEGLPLANVVKVLSKKAEPPQDLPKAQFLQDSETSAFGVTNFRNEAIPFGIKRSDRRRHVYVIGKTGVGKSKLLQLLMLADIKHGRGFAVLDPHGDLAEEILAYIPPERVDDVIYFNPADEESPVAFNPLEAVQPEYKQQVVTGFVSIFKKLFAFDWTSRLEHMLRYTTLALLDTHGSTIVDIVKLLTDKSFRQEVVANIQDPVVKNFWTHEFATWNEKFDNEAIVPLLNKVGEFVSSPQIRRTIGQPKSSFNFHEIMDKQKILIMNLSSGKIGEDNAALLGSMIVTHIQQAAMARARLPEAQRKDFYLYVDEFQNFATSAFAQILSEARKYRLCLTVAHQYIGQISEDIRKTVLGNIGSMIVFRVGSEDAQALATELAPVFTPEDMLNLDMRDMYLKISIDGKTSPPFSGRTITFPQPEKDLSQEVIASSRAKFATSKDAYVEESEIWGEEKSLPKKKKAPKKEELVKEKVLPKKEVLLDEKVSPKKEGIVPKETVIFSSSEEKIEELEPETIEPEIVGPETTEMEEAGPSFEEPII